MVSPVERSTAIPASRCRRPLWAEIIVGRLPVVGPDWRFANSCGLASSLMLAGKVAPKTLPAPAATPPASASTQNFLRVISSISFLAAKFQFRAQHILSAHFLQAKTFALLGELASPASMGSV